MTKQAGQPFDWTAWRCCEVTGWSTIEIVLEESHRELELLRLMTRAVYPKDEDYFVRQLGKRLRCGKDFAVQINLCR